MTKTLVKLLQSPYTFARQPEVKSWLFIITAAVLVYLLFSNGNFSFLMTIASLLESLGLLGIILQVRNNTRGLSFNTFSIYSVIYLTRLCSILPYDSYCPNDSTGDWVYQVIEIVSLIESLWIANKLKEIKEDRRFLLVIAGFFVFSVLVHPNLNGNAFTDMCWMISMMLRSVAIVPLIWRVKEFKDFEDFSSHFIAAQSVSIILNFIFWYDTYTELNSRSGTSFVYSNISGYFVIASQITTLVFTGEFLLYYIKSALLGTPLVLAL